MRQHAGWLVAAAAICALFAGSAYSGPTNPASVDGGVYNATPPTLSDGQLGVFQLDTNGNLKIAGTFSASITNPTIGAAVPATANYIAGNKGGLLVGVTLDASSYLNVNCQAGCAGGSFNNNADNVATSSTNGQAAAWMYAWDGSAWDRLYNANGTATQALRVTIASDSTGQVALAAGSTTAVTQGTASALNAQVVGTVADAGAASGNPVPVGGIYESTLPTYTNAQRTTLHTGSRGSLHAEIWGTDSTAPIASGAQADGVSNGAVGFYVNGRNLLFNGTSWDRTIAALNSKNITGTGLPVTSQAGQCDDTSPTALTENSFGNTRIGCTDHSRLIGALKSGVVTGLTTDASGYLQVNVAAGGGSGGTSSTFGAAYPATGTAVGMSDGTNMVALKTTSGTSLDVNCVVGCSGGAVTPTDARALGTTSLVTYSLGVFYNGSTTDMAREAVTGTNSVGTGIGAHAMLGQCLGTPGALTDTRFGNIAMNCTDHSLIVSGGLAQEATTSGTLGSGVMGSVTTSAPTYTTAKMDYLSLTTGGLLRVDGSGATQPVSGTVSITANSAINEAQINGVTPLMGNGVTGTGSQRVTIASDNTAFSVNGTLQTQTDTVMVGGVNVKEINGVTPLMGNGVTGTGSPRVTISSDNTTLSNTFGNVGQVPVTSGGTSIFTLTLAASTNATNVKASAGQLYSIDGFNMSSATPVWISTYNNAGTPTCGTGIIEQFMIPGNTTGAGLHANFSVGAAYSTGIAICATTGIAGTGNVAATTYVVNIHYK